MKEFVRFGLSTPIHRSDYGALLSREIERIIDFLRRNGLLIAELFDCYIVIPHPGLIGSIKSSLVSVGLQPLVIGATLANIRQVIKLSIAETRVLEILSPGALILEQDNSISDDVLRITIPDNYDLRDIACSLNGTMQVFIWRGEGGLTQLVEVLRNLELDKHNITQIGILETPLYEQETAPNRVTIVQVLGPGDVKNIVGGVFDFKTVKEASKNVSMWEIGEWT